MFQKFNDTYIGNIKLEGFHPQVEEFMNVVPDYLASHWDYQVLAKFRLQPLPGIFYMEVIVQRPFDNQAKFATWISTEFLKSLKDYLVYLFELWQLENIAWKDNWNFSINNAQKTHNLRPLTLETEMHMEFFYAYADADSNYYMNTGHRYNEVKSPQDTPWVNGSGA